MKKNFYILFLIPLIVGFLIALFQFVLPAIFKEEKELSYKIYKTISLIDRDKTESLNIVINGEKSNSLYNNQIDLENIGKIPLKKVPVKIQFADTNSIFKIYKYSISTIPEFEFGNIAITKQSNYIRLVAVLMNPHDKITINILTNRLSEIKVYSKLEGMNFTRIEDTESKKDKSSIILGILASVISIILVAFAFQKGFLSFELGGIKISFDSLNTAKAEEGLKIISAFYGKDEKNIDITDKLNKLIDKDNKLKVTVDNKIAGDPIHGVVKELKVVYSYGKELNTKKITEDGLLELPDTKENNTT